MVKLTMPILAIGGDHSFGEGVAMSMKFAADNVQSAVVKDCGHFVSEEQPAAFSKLLLEFFGKN
jgi:pimeloyl-ACP methyl ester carboxylesterase